MRTKRVDQNVQFARQIDSHHAALGFVGFSRERRRPADDAPVDAIEAAFGFGVDEQPRDEVHEIVAGRSGDPPLRSQAFRAEQDFLDDEIERLPERGRAIDQ